MCGIWCTMRYTRWVVVVVGRIQCGPSSELELSWKWVCRWAAGGILDEKKEANECENQAHKGGRKMKKGRCDIVDGGAGRGNSFVVRDQIDI